MFAVSNAGVRWLKQRSGCHTHPGMASVHALVQLAGQTQPIPWPLPLPTPSQCFGGPPAPAPAPTMQEESARAIEEAAWLRRMLEKEQQARAAAEQALGAERLRNALLEREVLAAAQVTAVR